MSIEATQGLIELAKLVVLPAIGFLAGLAAQWLLQERRSRFELLRALADKRSASLCNLWTLTTLPEQITALESEAEVAQPIRAALDRSVIGWYTAEAGALYLSWQATQLLFRFIDLLRSSETKKAELESAVSALRSRLKLDCGIYSQSDSKRALVRPRRAAWKP